MATQAEDKAKAEENAEAERRLAVISAALEKAAADLQVLVEQMRKVLEENSPEKHRGN